MHFFALRWLFALALSLWLTAPAGAANGSCEFRARGLSLNFGVLDPSSHASVSSPVVPSTSLADLAGDCNTAGPMTISIAGSSSRQLAGPGGGTINYTITGLPVSLPKPGNSPGSSGKNYVPWFNPGQLQGVIQWSAYADAPAGLYSDTVTVVITP